MGFIFNFYNGDGETVDTGYFYAESEEEAASQAESFAQENGYADLRME